MTSDSQEKSSPKLDAPKEKKAEKVKLSISALFSALGLLILEVLLPVLLAGGALWWLFANFNLWQTLNRTLGLVLFAVGLVVIAILLLMVINTFTSVIHKSFRRKGVRFSSDPRMVVVKLALGGILIPAILFAVANLVPIPGRGTVMNMLIISGTSPVKLTPPDEVGALALKTTNPATKVLSIQVLQGFHSPEALNQLLRLMSEDNRALADSGVAAVLSNSIAAYGADAKLSLLSQFQSIDPTQAGNAGASGDLYGRYFSNSFASLKDEITADTSDPSARDAQLAQLQAAQAQLQTNLNGLQSKTSSRVTGATRLDFILKTFLAMNIKQDADLLAFAKKTAGDARYSNTVRGEALLLIGKLGSAADLDVLYPYLKSGDELIQSQALQAITMLQAKTGGANSSQ